MEAYTGSSGTSNKAEGTSSSSSSSFRCVQCGSPIKTLYIQYSPGNIRLMKCGYCKAVADDYIECEIMILVIDLILHKPKAYRHLFYNRFSTKETVNLESLLWKMLSAFLILDIYKMWVLHTIEKGWSSPLTFGSLILDFGKMLSGVVFGNLIFFCVMFQGTRKLSSASALYESKEILLVILVSSYFKIFLMATMVWEFPSSVIFIIDMFVLSSNIVALKVITDSVIIRCLAVGILAHGLKFIASYGFILQKLIQPNAPMT